MGRGDYVLSRQAQPCLHRGWLPDVGRGIPPLQAQRHGRTSSTAFNRSRTALSKLVIADAVFSMDGDVIDLPRTVGAVPEIRRLADDRRGPFGGRARQDRPRHRGAFRPARMSIDIKMGTLSKTIPSVGGYIAGRKDLINYLRHASRAYIFSAALPPAQAAAANEAFKVIEDGALAALSS